MIDYKEIFHNLINHVEQEVLEYKSAENQYDRDKLGKYLSALSNEANLREVDFAWMILGVNNDRQVVGIQKFYRNECLCKGMVNFNMIDTVSSGIQTMFYKQMERHFPMPDYTINENVPEVNVLIYSKVIDEKYVELLKRDTTLSLKECIWLDSIQKKRPITDEALRILKEKKLVEWHRPNYIISQAVAQKTHQVPEYTKQKGLGRTKLVNMIHEVIDNAGRDGIMLKEIYSYMEDTLPSNKDATAKKRMLGNLLGWMKKKGYVETKGLRWITISKLE